MPISDYLFERIVTNFYIENDHRQKGRPNLVFGITAADLGCENNLETKWTSKSVKQAPVQYNSILNNSYGIQCEQY